MPMQIPLAELPDSMTVALLDAAAEYGGEYLRPVTIEHVRFERRESLSPNSYKLADGAQGRIWIDAVNSWGAFELPKGSKVVVDGRSMQVVECAPFKVRGRVHHWEVDVK